MNDTDRQKLADALGVVPSLEGQLGNIIKRAPGAIKEWEACLARETDPKLQATYKREIIAGAKQVLKEAKAALKDLGVLYKEGTDAKKLAKYPTPKDFRTKATKLLGSSKALDQTAMTFVLVLNSILGGGLYPGMGETNCKVTVDSLQNFNKYFNAIRIEFAKL